MLAAVTSSIVFLFIWFTILQHYVKPLVFPKRKTVSSLGFQEEQNDNVVASTLSSLAKHCPIIPVNSNNVDILSSPKEFRTHILDSIRNAKHRIYISALYFGTSEVEQSIIDALYEALRRNPDLQVHLVFDHRRSLRGFGQSKKGRKCCVELFDKLLRFNNFSLKLFHVPLFPYLSSITRIFELFGVLHTKFYVFDDDVIVSGANLSSDYLTGSHDNSEPDSGKQDRYFIFNATPQLAEWYLALYEVLSTHSYTTLCGVDGGLPSIVPPRTNPVRRPVKFKKELKRDLVELISTFHAKKNLDTDTFVLPTIQAGFAGVGHESHCLELFLKHLTDVADDESNKEMQVTITTPYLNFSNTVAKVLGKLSRKLKSRMDLIAASAKANSFYGAKI
ncbi:hypothetical protein P9112_001911 [Eukaryota sp. TZLM1-RC]